MIMLNKKWLRVSFIVITTITVMAFWIFSGLVYFEANNDNSVGISESKNEAVGIVKIHGWIQLIGDSANYEVESASIVAEIDAYASDPGTKVIVLDIHSSGGSTSGADEIIQAIKRADKPVIAMVREQAVSSAYLIASAADTIYADRYAVVGGMGITGSYLSSAGKNKLEGMEFVEISSGPHKDMWNRDRPMTLEERTIEQAVVDHHFDIYVQTVAEGRGIDISVVRKLADGRPYTAEQALQLKLIDHVGGMKEIILEALQSDI